MDPVLQVVLIIAALLLLGALGEWVFSRTRVPDMIWLVAAGIVAGPVFGLVTPAALAPVLPFFGAIALVVILAGGGLALRIGDVAEAAPRAILLGVLGFLFAVGATCLFGWVTMELGYTRPASMLAWAMIGSIVGGTSSVVILPTMARAKGDPQTARLLEVESCVTDALCVVVTMVMIDVVLKGVVQLQDPLWSLVTAVGLGLLLGAVGALAMLPALALLRGSTHAYVVGMAFFLVLYTLVSVAGGNGALGVLVAALLLGNAEDIARRLWPGHGFDIATTDDTGKVVHEHITFFIKSFFFFLLGLMFPTDLRLILLGSSLAVVLLLFRVPAVLIALLGRPTSGRNKALLMVAIPRGLAAGVLSALPLHYGVPGMENLAPGAFAMIVASILIFALGFSVLGGGGGGGEPARAGEPSPAGEEASPGTAGQPVAAQGQGAATAGPPALSARSP